MLSYVMTNNNLLFDIRAGFPHPVVVPNLFLGNNKDSLFFECGVKGQNPHKNKVG